MARGSSSSTRATNGNDRSWLRAPTDLQTCTTHQECREHKESSSRDREELELDAAAAAAAVANAIQSTAAAMPKLAPPRACFACFACVLWFSGSRALVSVSRLRQPGQCGASARLFGPACARVRDANERECSITSTPARRLLASGAANAAVPIGARSSGREDAPGAASVLYGNNGCARLEIQHICAICGALGSGSDAPQTNARLRLARTHSLTSRKSLCVS